MSIRNFLKSLFPNRPAVRRRPATPRLGVEALEDRRVLNAAFDLSAQVTPVDPNDLVGTQSHAFTPVQLSGDVLLIIGGETNEDASVWVNGNKIQVLTKDAFFEADAGDVASIVFHGGAGDDRFVNQTDLPSTAFGYGGMDYLVGGGGDDRLDGGASDDMLIGQGGGDTLLGGPGVDRLQGDVSEVGPDVLRGVAGRDTLRGGAGNDELFGQGVGDWLFGGAGNDVLRGGDGVDQLFGGSGHDDLYGGAGYDDLVGGGGIDYLDGTGDNAWTGDPESGFVPFDGSLSFLTIDDNVSRTNLVPTGLSMLTGPKDPLTGLTPPTDLLDLGRFWGANTSGIHDRVMAQISGFHPAGQNLYDIDLTLPDASTAEIAQDAWGVHLRLTVPGVDVVASSTTPSALGSWADPRFGISFDLVVTVRLAATGGFRVEAFEALMTNVEVRSIGVVADVLDFFGNITEHAKAELNNHPVPGLTLADMPELTTLVNEFSQAAPGASVTYDADSRQVIVRTPRQGGVLNIDQPTVWVVSAPDTGMGNVNEILAAFGPTEVVPYGDADGSAYVIGDWSDILGSLQLVDGGVSPLSDINWATLNPQPLPPREYEFEVYDADAVDLSAEATAVDTDDIVGLWDFFGTFGADANPFGLTDVVSVGEIDATAYAITDWSDSIGQTEYAEWGISPLSDINWATLNPQPLPPLEWSWNAAIVPYEAGSTLWVIAINQAAANYWAW